MYRPLLVLFTCLVLTASLSGKANASESDAVIAYLQASELIEAKSYTKALASLRHIQRTYPSYSNMSAVQTRVAVLQESTDAGESMGVFLSALDLRDQGDTAKALELLQSIASLDPAGTLTDDALYISAYLQVMDRFDFNAARQALKTLEERFPDSAYDDSALYLDAIALEQLGRTDAAKAALIELRERHTALSLPLKFRWPRGSVLARYWFDRADRRLAIVEKRESDASRLTSQEPVSDGKLRVGVSVSGVDMQLLLLPSPLTRTTQWLDGGLSEKLPPAIGVYDGVVEGISDSWVRVVLQKNSITGVVTIDGESHKLQPSNLIGTLEYYQPQSQVQPRMYRDDSNLANTIQGIDALVAPPATILNGMQRRSRSVQTDVRAVPVSIVIDSQFDRYYGGEGLVTALNNLNIADGLYRQFGLALSLDEAIKFGEQHDPMNLGRVTLETILRSFRDYRLEYETLFDGSALTYLFTGNPKTDVTLGLAWINTACRVDGYDVGVITPTSFGDVLLTHELGHSLGAQHDSDTACNTNSLSLMWPNISERTQTSFTECSKNSVLQSRTKSCLLNSVDLGLNGQSTGASVDFSIINPDTALTVDTQLYVETGSPMQLEWPAGCQSQTPTSALCYVDSVEPGTVREISFPISESFQNSDSPVSAEVKPVGVLELGAANNAATLSLLSGSHSTHQPLPGSAGDLLANSATISKPDTTNTTPVAAVDTGGGLFDLSMWLVFIGAGWVRIKSLNVHS